MARFWLAGPALGVSTVPGAFEYRGNCPWLCGSLDTAFRDAVFCFLLDVKSKQRAVKQEQEQKRSPATCVLPGPGWKIDEWTDAAELLGLAKIFTRHYAFIDLTGVN